MLEIYKEFTLDGATLLVSNMGNVRSIDKIVKRINPNTKKECDFFYKGRKLNGHVSHGYHLTRFGINSRRYKIQTGRLVLMAFIGLPLDGQECCHKNGNSLDNRLDNLRWDTHYNNNQDRVKHGTYAIGEKHPMAKITNIQAIEIFNSEESLSILSKKYGINKTKIWAIKNGKTWANITGVKI